jgi:uncharacterized phiE125 gp8 family phage protein
MALTVVTPPEIEPVSLADAKSHLRVDSTTEAADISALVAVARDYCERIQNRAYITQTLRLTLDRFPLYGGAIHLPRAPLQSVTELTYIDTTGVTRTLDDSLYRVDSESEPARITPAYGTSWPLTLDVTNALSVGYVAGSGNAERDVPAYARHAILLLVGHWYANREAVVSGTITKPIEFAVDALLATDRVY